MGDTTRSSTNTTKEVADTWSTSGSEVTTRMCHTTRSSPTSRRCTHADWRSEPLAAETSRQKLKARIPSFSLVMHRVYARSARGFAGLRFGGNGLRVRGSHAAHRRALYLAGKHVHWRYLWLLIQGDTGRNSSVAGYTYLSPVRLVAVRTIGRKRELGWTSERTSTLAHR